MIGGSKLSSLSEAYIGDKIGDFSGLPPFLKKHDITTPINV